MFKKIKEMKKMPNGKDSRKEYDAFFKAREDEA